MRPPPSDRPNRRPVQPSAAGDATASLAMPKQIGVSRALNVLTPAAAPDLSRVRLFINEIGFSFFRVISAKFSSQTGFNSDQAEQIKDGIKQLRDLGQEFMALGNQPDAQATKGLELRRLVERLFAVDPTQSGIERQGQVAIVKSFQLFLYLVEEAQNAERELRGRAREENNPGALDSLLEQSITSWGHAQVERAISKLNISFVFTKHPTTIKYAEMSRALSAVCSHFARHDWRLYYGDKGQRAFNAELDLDIIEKFRAGLDELIGKLWDLAPIRPEKPSVRTEVEEGYLELNGEVAPNMAAIRSKIKRRGIALNTSPIWSVKQWFGFDLDGHPFVDKNSVAGALFLNNVRYIADIGATFERALEVLVDRQAKSQLMPLHQRLEATLRHRARIFQQLLIKSSALSEFWYASELQRYLALKVEAEPYTSVEQCLSEIKSVCQTNNCSDIFEPFISRLEMSGFSLASGMFRENSKVLELIVTRAIPGYVPNHELDQVGNKSTDQLEVNQSLVRDFFSKSDGLANIKSTLASARQAATDKSPFDKALQSIETLEFIAYAQSDLGLNVVPEFILSLTENKSQILAFAKLLSVCGIQAPSRVIPLFEEYESLDRIDQHLRAFFEDLEILEALKGPDQKITIFLGMSDGQKTTGPFFPYLAADAEERILEVAREYDQDVVVFYGIGSSQARGQDRHPEREYAARPSLRYAPVVERTIQGEAIQRLRTQDLSKHVGAIIYNYLKRQDEKLSLESERNRQIDQDKRKIVKAMSAVAREQFSELTLSDEFSYFLGHFSPALDSLNPASRPNNRSAKPDQRRYRSDFADLRAVPANYQDIQAQTLLSTWYGAGAAFELAQGPILGQSQKVNLANSRLLYAPESPFYDARFHKNIQFMIEAIASSGLDVTAAMLQIRLEAVEDAQVRKYLKAVLTKLKAEQVRVIAELEKFVPNDGSAKDSASMRARAFGLLDSPLLKDDISRRLPYITVLSFVAVFGLNIHDQYLERDPAIAQYGFDLARIAACGKANGYRQVG